MSTHAENAFIRAYNPPDWRGDYSQNAMRFAVRVRNSRRDSKSFDIEAAATTERDRVWRDITKVDAKDTRFTIIMPIHDEERFLPSVLGTLTTTLLPSTGDINIVFVTNGCSDNSSQIVENFMHTLGEEEQININQEYPNVTSIDNQAGSKVTKTKYRGITFSHIDTPTPGKANALNIGNQVALDTNHKVAVCLDANTFPEVTAVARIYGEAHSSILQGGGETAVVSGRYLDYATDEEIYFGMSPRRLLPSYIGASNCVVIGALSAWDTEFLSEMGGVPSVKSDDFVMGIMTLAEGRKVKNISAAGTWRYVPTTLEGRREMLTRYVAGALQVASLNPDYRRLVESSMFFMGGEKKLVNDLRQWAAGDPQRTAALPTIIAEWKRILKNGTQMFNQSPDDQTWEPIEGTK